MVVSDDSRDDFDGGIAFFDENRGVVAVDFTKEATIWWTEDGGTNWNPVKIAAAFPPGVTSYRVYDVAVGGDSTVALACYHRVCLVSTDDGRTFKTKVLFNLPMSIPLMLRYSIIIPLFMVVDLIIWCYNDQRWNGLD
jgi:hypothetical protein